MKLQGFNLRNSKNKSAGGKCIEKVNNFNSDLVISVKLISCVLDNYTHLRKISDTLTESRYFAC
jgi:hypothetical protein